MSFYNSRHTVDVETQTFFTVSTLHRYRDKFHLPDWQRRYVWSAQDAVHLLDSMVKGYPIGAFLLWEYRWGSVYVVDGQQRATTLLGATLWRPDAPQDASLPLPFKMFFDYGKDSFVALPRNAADPDPRQMVPLSVLIDSMRFFPWFRAVWQEDAETERILQTACDVADSLRGHHSPFVRICPGADKDTVLDIFRRINTAGQPLDTDEVERLIAETQAA